MKKTRVLALVLAPVGIWAQPALAPPIVPPQLGFVTDGARALRPVYGVAGSFVLGPAVAAGAANAAFSGTLGLLKTDSSLVAFNAQGKLLGSTAAGAGGALFAFSADGTSALAYLSAGDRLVEWSGGRFVPIPLDPELDGTVIAIAIPSSDGAVLIVERERGLWEQSISLNGSGTLSQNALPGIHAPVLPLASGGLVYTQDGAIVIRRADGSEVRLAASLPLQFALQPMNRDWVELADLRSTARFALRTTLGREAFYGLPEPSAEPSR